MKQHRLLTNEKATYRQEDYDRSGNVGLARRIQFEPMLGLFNQEKLIPLRCCPIQIELQLVNQQADAVTTETSQGFQNCANWDLSDIQCKCDLLELDSSLSNEYASHLLSGKSLPINFNTWNHTNQSTGLDKDFSSHTTRAVTRLYQFIEDINDTKVGGLESLLNYMNENSVRMSQPLMSIITI